MGKQLVVVESPAKSKTLSRFLGSQFEIFSTVGHIIDLPKSKLGVEIDDNFEPLYQVIKGKEKLIEDLKKAAKKADKVFLAPDPDREGEAIAWHVAESLKSLKKECVRVTFNEITKKAVVNAIENPRQIDNNLVFAQQARRVLDRLVGYKVSPFLWKTIARNLSAGRVQSVALRVVCEREEEINNFNPREYWQIEALFGKTKKQRFNANLTRIDDQAVIKAGENRKGRIIGSEVEVEAILTELQSETFTVNSIKKSKKTRKALPPFITSTLQQDAARAYGFSPKQTMATAQKLYEGIEIGKDGPVGLITYMRTDSTRIADEALTAVRELITESYGDNYLPDKPNEYKNKKNSQDAHEAIRPTNLELTPDKVKKNLTPQQFKLYSLIWNRFVASQMKQAEYDVLAVDIAADKYLFRAGASSISFDGFLRVYQETNDPDENGNDSEAQAKLPALKENQTLDLYDIVSKQSFTKPPARYTEASLVKRLEADGIGRPSTYAMIITTIKTRKYVDLQEKKLHPTELGQAVNKILVENFPEIFNVAFTAEMEEELDAVEEGQESWVNVVRELYQPLQNSIESLKGQEKKIKEAMTESTDIACEKCGEKMVIKWGRNGRFLACSAYPNCRSTKPLPGEEEQLKTDAVCEKCNSPMVVKTGRFGRFLACSAYPDCRNTKPLTLGIPCPKDDCEGEIFEKRTRRGRVFYGCTKYPNCNFATWDKPVAQKCPSCDYPIMVFKSTKSKGEYYKCPECKAEVTEENLVKVPAS